MFAGGEKMTDLAEHPRPALCRAADHYRIGLGVFQYIFDALRRGDVAVGDHRDANLRLDRGNGVVLGLAGITAGAGAAVNRQRLDAGTLGDARHHDGIAVIAVPAGADFQRHRHIDCADHGLEDARDQRFVLQQCRTRHHIADFFRRATHVDIDDLRALIDVVTRGVGKHLRIRAGDLHRDRIDFTVVVGTTLGFFRTPQQGIARHHLRHRHAGAHRLAQLTERAISHARHRCHDEVVFQLMRADAHRLCSYMGNGERGERAPL